MTTSPASPTIISMPVSGPTDLARRQDLTGDGSDLAISTSLRLDVTQENIVAIRVAEAESAIRTRVAQTSRELSALSSTLSSLQGQRDLYLSSWSQKKAAADSRVKPFITAASAFLNTPPRISFDTATYDPRSETINADVRITGDALSLEISYSDSTPSDFLSLLESIKSASDAVATKQREVAAGRLALNNVDALERQARAALAKTLVSRTGEAGRAIVEAIQHGAAANTDDLIAALGL